MLTKTMQKLKLWLLFMLLLTSGNLSAQTPGTLDLSFNPAESLADKGLRARNVYDIVEQPDGKILIGGNFSSYDGKPVNGIIRVNADLTLDATFEIDDLSSGDIRDIELLADGKILIGGYFVGYHGEPVNHIARLMPNGELDGSFDPLGSFNNYVWAITALPDGKILVGGNFSTYQQQPADFMIRLNADGSIDPSFSANGIFNERVKSILVQGDKYIVAGWFTECHGNPEGRIVRLNTDGSCDQTFDPGSGASSEIETATFDKQGRILVGGTFTQFNGSTANRLTRLESDGQVDLPFQSSTLLNGEIYKIEALDDGSIIFVGGFSVFSGESAYYLVKISDEGTFIPLAGVNPETTNKVFSLDVLSNGNIMVGGEFYQFNGFDANLVAMLDDTGSFIEALEHNAGPNREVYAIEQQPDGKLLIGGRFTSYNGQSAGKLARLNQDGSLDGTFTLGNGFNGDVYGITVLPDGRILVAGGFTQLNAKSHRRLVRLLSDGSIDPTFQIGTGFNLPVYETIQQPDGKIIAAGFFTNFNGQVRGRIVRLNSDGSEDNSFNSGSGFNSFVQSIHLLDDGRILAAGDFESYQSQPHGRIIRLQSNGTVDPSFNSGVGFNGIVEEMDVDEDGGMVLVGGFSSYDGFSRNRIVKLLPDGEVDVSFDVGTGLSGLVIGVQFDSRSRVIVYGNMGRYDGVLAQDIFRLHPDGSRDTDFFKDQTIDNIIHAVAVLDGDNLLIGGSFERVGTHYRSNIARLYAGVPTSDVDPTMPDVPQSFSLEPNFPNPFNPTTTLRVELPQASDVEVKVYDLTGRVVMQLPTRSLQAGRHSITLDASRLGSGVYVYRVSTGTWMASGKMTLVK